MELYCIFLLFVKFTSWFYENVEKYINYNLKTKFILVRTCLKLKTVKNF